MYTVEKILVTSIHDNRPHRQQVAAAQQSRPLRHNKTTFSTTAVLPSHTRPYRWLQPSDYKLQKRGTGLLSIFLDWQLFFHSDLTMFPPGVSTILARAPNVERHTETKTLVFLAWDVLISSLCNAALPLTSFVFTGMWLDAAEAAGLGLGISVCNITGV